MSTQLKKVWIADRRFIPSSIIPRYATDTHEPTPESRVRKLTIIFHDAGGGHRSAALALKEVLSNPVLTNEEQPWEVSLLNLQELLDRLDVLRNLTGVRIQDTYNHILRKGWTRLSPQLLRALQRTVRLYHRRIVKVLQDYWAGHPADLILSVIPHFNRAIAESLGGINPRPPFVTLITDLADYPPRFWIERESEYIIAGTEKARQQALALGHPEDHVFLVSGMILKPPFYRPVNVDRIAERQRLGLEADCPTGIVLFGGHGSRVMLDIARRLDRARAGVQLIMLCGHNQKLAAQLKALKTSKPILVQEFTPNVEYYMALADFFVGKPGPGSISEALQMHLPVIVECNAKTLPQERYNAQWVAENKFGVVTGNFREIGSCLEQLLQPANFNQFRAAASAYSNRALLEVHAILQHCWERSSSKRSGWEQSGREQSSWEQSAAPAVSKAV